MPTIYKNGRRYKFPYTKKGIAQAKAFKNKSRGVPIGYPENWTYRGRWKERKLRKGLWGFDFKATKRRRANSYGSFGKGTRGRWKIVAVQDIVKTNKGEYQTRMRGFKKPIYFVVKRPYR